MGVVVKEVKGMQRSMKSGPRPVDRQMQWPEAETVTAREFRLEIVPEANGLVDVVYY
jgi:hypothetical protein